MLLRQLDLLDLQLGDLRLAHADEAAVHADVRRFGPRPAQQQPHGAGEPGDLHLARQTLEGGLDGGDLLVRAGELAAHVVDLRKQPVLARAPQRQLAVLLGEPHHQLLNGRRQRRDGLQRAPRLLRGALRLPLTQASRWRPAARRPAPPVM